MIPASPSRGSKSLLRWRKNRVRLTQAAACVLMDLDHATYCAFERGRKVPGLKRAIRIKSVTGIPVEAWLTPVKAA